MSAHRSLWPCCSPTLQKSPHSHCSQCGELGAWPSLDLPSWSQLRPCPHSVALNSIRLQQYMTYICPKQRGFRGGREPEVLSDSPCRAANGEEIT